MYSVVTVYSVVTWSGSDPFLTCIMITKLSQVLYKKTYKTVQQYLMSHLISYFIFKKLKFVIFERFIKIVWPIDTVDPKLWKNWIRIHPKFLWKFSIFHTKILKSYSLQFTEMNTCSIFNKVYWSQFIFAFPLRGPAVAASGNRICPPDSGSSRGKIKIFGLIFIVRRFFTTKFTERKRSWRCEVKHFLLTNL